MGRTGIKPEDAVEYAKQIQKLSNLNIEGVFTHFASADTDEQYTNMQIGIFNETVRKIENERNKI